MPLLSAVVLARNEEHNLGLALRSLAPCADEVVVVDGGSTDGTVRVAKEHGARVVKRSPRADLDADRARGVAAAKGDWILFLDADEVLPPALATRLRDVAAQGEADVVTVPEESFFLGQVADVWPRRRKPRLFRRDAVELSATVHAFVQPRADARIRHLPRRRGQVLVHYWTDGADALLARLQRYTAVEAQQRGPQRLTGLRLMAIVAGQFLRSYAGNGGWRRGWRGLYLSLHQAMARATVAVRRDEMAQGGAATIRAAYRRHAEALLGGKA